MIKPTLQIGDPRLKAKNKSIDSFASPKIQQIIKDLKDTMRENQLIGIAAPQISYNFKLFVTEPRKTKDRTANFDQFRVYINPQITLYSNKQSIIYEGCGSVLNGQLFGPVERPVLITIQAFNEKGNKFQLKCNGILSRVIQHEYDHLSGIEFTEKIYDYKKLMHVDFYRQFIKNSPEQISASKITVLECQSHVIL